MEVLPKVRIQHWHIAWCKPYAIAQNHSDFPLVECSCFSCHYVFVNHVTLAIFDTVGITGLSAESFKDNWDSMYQNTDSAGIPDRDGKVYWNFK